MRAAPSFAAIALLVCSLMCAAPAHAAQPAEFQTMMDNIQALKVPGVKGTVGDALKGALTGWEYTLPLEFVRKGQAYVGPNLRLRRVMNDLLAGKEVTVTVLGGSISTGAVASRKQAKENPNDVWSLVRLYMQKNINGDLVFNNNARSATKSYITSLCLDKFLDNTSDLVFVEFIANDGSEMDLSYTDNQKARFFERFLRKILRKTSAPAVVMMQFFVNEMTYPQGGQDGKPKRGYQASPEDTYYNLAQYYDIPTISFRYATYTMGEFGKVSDFDWTTLMGPDRLHPADQGHKAAADLVVYMLQQTLVDLQIHPAGAAERASRTAPLPAPMYDANEIGVSTPVCAMGKNLTKLIASAEGWKAEQDFSNSLYPTDGMETVSQGKPLVLQVDTTSPDGRPATVFLVYTKAQTGIAGATITCGNGCECPDRYLDGSLTYNQLVTFIDGIQPSAAPKCQISITMAGNATAGDKLRVNGVAVTSDPGLISNARIGETKYMSWLLGDKWAA